MQEKQMCPTCLQAGRKSYLTSYQINLDEAIVLCGNKKCIYPLTSDARRDSDTFSRQLSDLPSKYDVGISRTVPDAQRSLQARVASHMNKHGHGLQHTAKAIQTGSPQLLKKFKPFSNTNSKPFSQREVTPVSQNNYLPLQKKHVEEFNSQQNENDCGSNWLKRSGSTGSFSDLDSAYTISNDNLDSSSDNSSDSNTNVKAKSRAIFPGFHFSSPNILERLCNQSSGGNDNNICANESIKDIKNHTSNGTQSDDENTVVRNDTSAMGRETVNIDTNKTCITVGNEICKPIEESLTKSELIVYPEIETCKPIEETPTGESDLTVYPNIFPQWRNKEALCWLDVVLCLSVHSVALRQLVFKDWSNENCVIHKLIKAHVQAQQILENGLDRSKLRCDSSLSVSPSSCSSRQSRNSKGSRRSKKSENPSPINLSAGGLEDRQVGAGVSNLFAPLSGSSDLATLSETSSDMLNRKEQAMRRKAVRFEIESVLNEIREEIWTCLKTRLRCKKGQPESPVFALPLFLRQHQSASELFKMKYRFEYHCSECSYSEESEVENVLPTFPQLFDNFNITSPAHRKQCPSCGNNDDPRTMIYKRLSQCMMLHFTDGLPTMPWADLQFCFHGDTYKVTGVVQYMRNPDHFVAWLRNPNSGIWMECDDLKSCICKYWLDELHVPMSQIHIVMWEKITSAHSSSSLRLTGITNPLNQCVTSSQSQTEATNSLIQSATSSLCATSSQAHKIASICSDLNSHSLLGCHSYQTGSLQSSVSNSRGLSLDKQILQLQQQTNSQCGISAMFSSDKNSANIDVAHGSFGQAVGDVPYGSDSSISHNSTKDNSQGSTINKDIKSVKSGSPFRTMSNQASSDTSSDSGQSVNLPMFTAITPQNAKITRPVPCKQSENCAAGSSGSSISNFVIGNISSQISSTPVGMMVNIETESDGESNLSTFKGNGGVDQSGFSLKHVPLILPSTVFCAPVKLNNSGLIGTVNPYLVNTSVINGSVGNERTDKLNGKLVSDLPPSSEVSTDQPTLCTTDTIVNEQTNDHNGKLMSDLPRSSDVSNGRPTLCTTETLGNEPLKANGNVVLEPDIDNETVDEKINVRCPGIEVEKTDTVKQKVDKMNLTVTNANLTVTKSTFVNTTEGNDDLSLTEDEMLALITENVSTGKNVDGESEPASNDGQIITQISGTSNCQNSTLSNMQKIESKFDILPGFGFKGLPSENSESINTSMKSVLNMPTDKCIAKILPTGQLKALDTTNSVVMMQTSKRTMELDGEQLNVKSTKDNVPNVRVGNSVRSLANDSSSLSEQGKKMDVKLETVKKGLKKYGHGFKLPPTLRRPQSTYVKDAFLTINSNTTVMKTQPPKTVQGDVTNLNSVKQYLLNRAVNRSESKAKFEGLSLTGDKKALTPPRDAMKDFDIGRSSGSGNSSGSGSDSLLDSRRRTITSNGNPELKRKLEKVNTLILENDRKKLKIGRKSLELTYASETTSLKENEGGDESGNGDGVNEKTKPTRHFNKQMIMVDKWATETQGGIYDNGASLKLKSPRKTLNGHDTENEAAVLKDLYEALNIPYSNVKDTMDTIMADVEDIMQFVDKSEIVPSDFEADFTPSNRSSPGLPANFIKSDCWVHVPGRNSV